jgi:hypothetical protein
MFFVALPWTRSSHFCNLVFVVPILLPPNPILSFFKSSLQTNNTSEPTLLWGTGHYYCRGVINLSSPNSPLHALSCLQIKPISCELQNISGNTVIKFSSLPPCDFNFHGDEQAVSVQSRNSVFFSYQWSYLFFSIYISELNLYKFHTNYVSTIFVLNKRLVRVKFSSVIIFINVTINITLLLLLLLLWFLLLLLQSPHGAGASTAISQMRPIYIKTLDGTALHCCVTMGTQKLPAARADVVS